MGTNVAVADQLHRVLTSVCIACSCCKFNIIQCKDFSFYFNMPCRLCLSIRR